MQEMRERFLPLLESYGCDLVLSGHSHSYERSYYLQGHYGYSDTFDPEAHLYNGGDGDPTGDGAYSTLNGEGTVYITAGNSGKITGTLTRHAAIYAPIYERGSLVIDVSNQVMQVRLLDDQARVRDDFTIRHDVTELPVLTNDAPYLVHPTDTRIAFDITEVGESTEVTLYYGPIDQGKQLDAWANAVTVGTTTSDLSQAVATLSGLNDSTTYFYRLFAQNENGGSWSPATKSFTTDSNAYLPNVEFATTGGSSISTQLVSKGSVWAYDDDGSVDSDWRDLQYDASSWDNGPGQLGYGDDDEQTVVSYGSNHRKKHVTTWFRHEFEVDDPGLLDTVTLSLMRDDGAVVYLNGAEVARDNLPSGPITDDTLANGAVGGGAESQYFDFSVPPSSLRAGKNVVAVEIHQANKTSSDISFDLALFATGDTPGQVVPMTNITHNTATGVADVLNLGAGTMNLVFYYGTTDGGSSTQAWDTSLSMPVGSVGEIPFLLGGLEPDTLYYVRLAGVNEIGLDWSEDTLTFMTSPAPPPVDSDGDGLDDVWEITYFGDITTTDGLIDSDGDGQIDGGEYYAGTDPTDNASILHLDLECSLDGLDHYLMWTNHPGLLVDIQNCPDLNDPNGWLPLIDDVPNGTYTNTIIPGDRVFYRLRLTFP